MVDFPLEEVQLKEESLPFHSYITDEKPEEINPTEEVNKQHNIAKEEDHLEEAFYKESFFGNKENEIVFGPNSLTVLFKERRSSCHNLSLKKETADLIEATIKQS